METPEKIILQEPTKVRTQKIYDNDIEYIRKDAFIEKVKEYLYKQLNEGNMECGDIETFIEDFKNYMKGE